MARIGTSLSASQKNDWIWFKEFWDAAMVKAHGKGWGVCFAGYMQRVMEQHQEGVSNAFSQFVYNEACRVFHEVAALHVPEGPTQLY